VEKGEFLYLNDFIEKISIEIFSVEITIVQWNASVKGVGEKMLNNPKVG